jgi:bloom syndrome protein
MDIPHIERVIQFMVPPSLSVWVQRLGRAGRSGHHAIAVLLVESSIFQKVKVGKQAGEESSDEDDESGSVVDSDGENNAKGNLEYKKQAEGGMRQWVEALNCRRDVSNTYFNNPQCSRRKCFIQVQQHLNDLSKLQR